MDIYKRHVKESQELYALLGGDSAFADAVTKAGDILTKALNDGKTVLVAGNGGSAAEAQHFSAELVGRYKKERRALPSIALTTDTSAMTAIGNDYSFDTIFARQVEALGRPGDILVLLSTSGNSENLMRAAAVAKERGVTTIAVLGKGGGALGPIADLSVTVPSDDTPRIQEVHLLLIHAWSELIDERCA